MRVKASRSPCIALSREGARERARARTRLGGASMREEILLGAGQHTSLPCAPLPEPPHHSVQHLIQHCSEWQPCRGEEVGDYSAVERRHWVHDHSGLRGRRGFPSHPCDRLGPDENATGRRSRCWSWGLRSFAHLHQHLARHLHWRAECPSGHAAVLAAGAAWPACSATSGWMEEATPAMRPVKRVSFCACRLHLTCPGSAASPAEEAAYRHLPCARRTSLVTGLKLVRAHAPGGKCARAHLRGVHRCAPSESCVHLVRATLGLVTRRSLHVARWPWELYTWRAALQIV